MQDETGEETRERRDIRWQCDTVDSAVSERFILFPRLYHSQHDPAHRQAELENHSVVRHRQVYHQPGALSLRAFCIFIQEYQLISSFSVSSS